MTKKFALYSLYILIARDACLRSVYRVTVLKLHGVVKYLVNDVYL